MFKKMLVRDSVSWSSMLHGHVKCNGLESAAKFFDEMPQRDTVTWTVMITGHVQQKQPVRALELFRLMNADGFRPTLITIVGVLSACADIGALNLGHAIHGYINKLNVSSDIIVYNVLIDMYSKSGNLEMAKRIFDGILHKDVYTWTTMILGFAVHGDGRGAIELFSEMLSSRVKPNEITFLAVLTACGHAGMVDEGREWFDKMDMVYSSKPQLAHYGCMVDLLGRAGLLADAKKLIQQMGSNADGVIWRSLLSACLFHGNLELAEVAGLEIIKRELDDDGVYVLLCNVYASSDRRRAALDLREQTRDRKVVKKPGCSWIEVIGLVHEFMVGDRSHSFHSEIHLIRVEIAKQLERDGSTSHISEDVQIF